ncbi:MAG: CHASE2 domain-containing protein, partial [Rickettsiales bacterium]
MADAALERTGDVSGVWSRVQTILPWQKKTAPEKKNTDSDDEDKDDSGRRRWKIPVASLVCIAILVAGMLIRIIDPPFVESLRVKTFDLYQRLSPRPLGDYPVGIIDIDEKSLAKIGQWPWPRTMIAKLLDQAHKMGAAVVGFDVVFAEQD